MTIYTYGQLEQLWEQAGGNKNLDAIMAAIAEAESRGNSTATGADSEEGLWQIDPHYWPSQYVSYDPLTNAKGAVHVEAVQGLGAWSTYNSGAYKAFLSPGTAPVATGVPTSASTTGISIPGLPGVNIPGVGGSGSSLDPIQTLLQWISGSVFGALGIPDLKDLLQRLALILLGAVLLIVGLNMLTKGGPNIQPPQPTGEPEDSGSSGSAPKKTAGKSAAKGAGASGTGALASEASEAAVLA